MSFFSYQAVDAQNAVREGIVDEADEGAVARRLLREGLRPLSIRPYSAPSARLALGNPFRAKRLVTADIDFFTDQLTLLLNAGLSLAGCLRILRQNSRKPAFQELAGRLEQMLKEGKSFSEALTAYPRQFPPMYVSMVRAGEEGGILPVMLAKLADYQRSFRELRQFIVSASIYPLVLMLVGLGAVLILVTTILPKFEVLFQGMGQDLPANVRVLMATALFIKSHPLVTLLVLLLPPFLVALFFRSAAGRRRLDRLLVRLPVVSGFVRGLETTRIFRTMEVLLNNGVHLATSLRIATGVAVNGEFRGLLEMAGKALKEGKHIAPPLKAAGLFPDLAMELLAVGEESGRMGTICTQIADHFEANLKVQVKRLIALVEPLFILLIAVVAGYVVLSMLSVILSINEIAG